MSPKDWNEIIRTFEIELIRSTFDCFSLYTNENEFISVYFFFRSLTFYFNRSFLVLFLWLNVLLRLCLFIFARSPFSISSLLPTHHFPQVKSNWNLYFLFSCLISGAFWMHSVILLVMGLQSIFRRIAKFLVLIIYKFILHQCYLIFLSIKKSACVNGIARLKTYAKGTAFSCINLIIAQFLIVCASCVTILSILQRFSIFFLCHRSILFPCSCELIRMIWLSLISKVTFSILCDVHFETQFYLLRFDDFRTEKSFVFVREPDQIYRLH